MNLKPLITVAIALFVSSGHTDPVDPDATLAAHNKWRSEVGVAGLRWSEVLQQQADKWAAELEATNACRMKHSGSGENLYWAGPLKAANAVDSEGNWIWQNSLQAISEANMVDSWGSEKQWYDYATNSCNAPVGESCGHYTQVVWRDTQEVGCAKAVCDDFSQVWVCNYKPAGNVTGEKPY